MDSVSRLLWVMVLAAAVLLPPAVARAGQELFTATVPVADESPEARRAAMAEALRQVLVRASGRRLAGRGEALQAVLEEAENQARSFRYRSVPEGEGRLLEVRFDRRQVEGDLRRLGMLLWEDRPEVVPWVAVEEKGRRRLADPERDARLFRRLEEAARRRGLPLVPPLLDLQDREALSVADLWLGHRESLERATARYGRALPLAVRLKRVRRGWQGEWLLLLPDDEAAVRSGGAAPEEVIDQGIDQVADELARRYLPAPETADRTPVRVRFLGLHDPADYAFLVKLLEGLDLVRSAVPVQATGDVLVFRVETLGGAEALARRLALVPELVPVVDVPLDDETGAASLAYALR